MISPRQDIHKNYMYDLPELTVHDLAVILQTNPDLSSKLMQYNGEGLNELEIFETRNIPNGHYSLKRFPFIDRKTAILGIAYALYGFEGDREMTPYRGLVHSQRINVISIDSIRQKSL